MPLLSAEFKTNMAVKYEEAKIYARAAYKKATTRTPKEPKETEEMQPQWFAVEDIPYQKMWADDRYWYPLLLAGKKFEGDFYFENTHKLVKHQLKEK